MRDIGTAVDRYEGELARRGRALATRRKYINEVLGPFADKYRHLELQDVRVDHCRQYLDKWVNSSESTLALYVTVVRGFFEFCVNEGWLEVSPATLLQRPRRKRPEDLDVVTVAASDVERLIAACEEWDDYLCILGLCYLGSRRNALALARRRDVDLVHGTIRLHEKGGKVIVKPIPDQLVSIIRMADGKGVWGSPGDYLIPNRGRTRRTGERSNKVVYATVKRVAARAGVNVHPHALRAAFAVQFDEQNPREIWALKELLGHARIETTLVYLRRKNKAKAMDSVRGLSWPSAFPPSTDAKPNEPEPAFENSGLPPPLRLKLDELRVRSRKGSKRG